jgi:hypothetical protein
VFIKFGCFGELKLVCVSCVAIGRYRCYFYIGSSNLTLNLRYYLVGMCLDEKDHI